ncbi:hypothetical protein LC605_23560 [Nostoc sp. CHAB 5836]|uniref:hypothetical protein n=1 Tax=Nostoc sp. CHAB 5836 TaxID=2780404 RepID=UPI001E592053|nr:hypothetical protein [Nostoc sp. CHAB 5836]MCC5618007.1 hypothetical protein [Nostoc sp. CHAB 5836]
MFEIIKRQNNPKWNITEDLAGYMFMMPTILVLGTFVVLPILYAVFLSLQKVQLLGGIEYEFICDRIFVGSSYHCHHFNSTTTFWR